ncbi:aspartate aminotransferase family protein, partial [Candidatus Bipolaricaulota bacterium]|nr:aspartate aminotransferase family protein [Candidatus Bipolaricaulota bacterium]
MSQSSGHEVGEDRDLPGTNAEALIELRERYIPKAEFHVVPTCVEQTEGARIRDVDGNNYIDFASGIACLNVGHTHDKVTRAIKEQAEKYLHTSFNVTMYEPFIKMAQRLCNSAPGDFPKQAMLFNSGAEAVENAVKVARKYTDKYNVIAFEHAFHGRTQLTMGLTSRVKNYKYGFGPTDLGITRFPYAYCYRCPYDKIYPDCEMWCVDRIEKSLEATTYVAPEETAAIILEPILGEGGYVVPPPEFLQGLRDICDRHDILLISDEIQVGAGRTGEMWAAEKLGAVPDIITAAKSIAGGMVLSATIGRKEVMDSVDEGGLGGTFGGHPLSCAAGLAAMDPP